MRFSPIGPTIGAILANLRFGGTADLWYLRVIRDRPFQPLLGPDLALFDYFAPQGNFGRNNCGKFSGSTSRSFYAIGQETIAQLRTGKRRIDCSVEPIDDCGRRAGRRENPEPGFDGIPL